MKKCEVRAVAWKCNVYWFFYLDCVFMNEIKLEIKNCVFSFTNENSHKGVYSAVMFLSGTTLSVSYQHISRVKCKISTCAN